MTDSAKTCAGCVADTPTRGARICPACGHVFRGNGWDGIDAHWRSRHESEQSYEQFFSGLCREHREFSTALVATTEPDLEREAASATEILAGKVVKQVWRHRPGEVGFEFTDGTRLFVNRADEGLELSAEGPVV